MRARARALTRTCVCVWFLYLLLFCKNVNMSVQLLCGIHGSLGLRPFHTYVRQLTHTSVREAETLIFPSTQQLYA